MKLPNGFGSIHKLSGNRRNPWRARKTKGWVLDEKTGVKKQVYETIGYYPTQKEALQALSNYNENPYDIHSDITLKEVFEKWSETKFEKISRSNINGYKAAFKLCSPIENMRFIDIKLPHLQGIVNDAEKNYPTLKKLKILFNQLYDYSVMNDIISSDKHISKYIDIGNYTKSDKHYRFTDSEIQTMWRWSNQNEYVQVILMLIYSGVRPGELFALKKSLVNLEEQSFFIEKGKNNNAIRKVPIHKKTYPFFVHWMHKNDSEYLLTQINGKEFRFNTNHSQYTESYWIPLLRDMGILEYKNDKGEIKEHTPDDTRHTFTTLWKEKRLDESMRRKIQGHSGKGIGEIVYTHYEFELLKEELNKF